MACATYIKIALFWLQISMQPDENQSYYVGENLQKDFSLSLQCNLVRFDANETNSTWCRTNSKYSKLRKQMLIVVPKKSSVKWL